MSEEPTPSFAERIPAWALPAVVIGAIMLITAMVAYALTVRPLDTGSTLAQPTEFAHPTGEPITEEDLPVAHGSLDPDGPEVSLISPADAKARFDAGTALFIDVRAGSDYAAGHIPGALTITAVDLNARMQALPSDAVIIAYGDAVRPESGPRGAQIFMELGFTQVIALDGGFQAWEQAAYPTESNLEDETPQGING